MENQGQQGEGDGWKAVFNEDRTGHSANKGEGKQANKADAKQTPAQWPR